MNHAYKMAGGLLMALAADGTAAAAGDPADTKAAAPPLAYRSPFHDYRGFGEDNLIPWKQANDDVGRIGGWRVYAREASAPSPPPAPVTAPAPTATAPPAGRKPARTDHDHHR